jgi:hypothetical protein
MSPFHHQLPWIFALTAIFLSHAAKAQTKQLTPAQPISQANQHGLGFHSGTAKQTNSTSQPGRINQAGQSLQATTGQPSTVKQAAATGRMHPTNTVVPAAGPGQMLENPGSNQEIPWLRSATEAAKLAQSTGKPILIYVRSKNCHYCDLLQQNTWQNQSVKAQVLQNAIPLKLTLEENPEAVKAMQVKGFPSTILFSHDRKYLARVDGYFKPEDFSIRLSGLSTPSVR